MSMEAYRWALTWTGISSSEKFVLVLIADHYNDKAHRSWPSIERLAKESQLHRSTVIRCIKSLQDEGLIEVEPWVRVDTGGALNNRYCLPLYDPKSQRAKNLPVRSFSAFDQNGRMEHDTFPHKLRHDEEVPGYVA